MLYYKNWIYMCRTEEREDECGYGRRNGTEIKAIWRESEARDKLN